MIFLAGDLRVPQKSNFTISFFPRLPNNLRYLMTHTVRRPPIFYLSPNGHEVPLVKGCASSA